MKSRILPRAAKVLLSSNVPEGEVEWLKAMLDKRRGFVDAREAVLRSKVVFNRKVAAAMGSETKGQVSLDKVLPNPKPFFVGCRGEAADVVRQGHKPSTLNLDKATAAISRSDAKNPFWPNNRRCF